ncbi:MAG: CHAT domain-containing protein [Bacteroidia bacterium]|jgi:CHAT domain-containing protein|tara:strand:+ start:2182 stop:4602 length:2421 start_codon:yes stop_codon:yes gene_type:complete
MRLGLFIALFSCFISLWASREQDSMRVMQLGRSAVEYRNSDDLVNAIKTVKIAIELADKSGLSDEFINNKLRNFLANRYSNIGDFERAIEVGKMLQTYYLKTGNKQRELLTKNNLGVYHQNIGKYEQAYNYFSQGWNAEKISGDVIDKLDWLDGLASSCIYLKRLEEAQLYLDKSLALLRAVRSDEEKEMQLYYFINRAQLAKAMGDKEQGLPMLKKAAHIANFLGNRKGVDAMNKMAKIYLGIESYPSVIAQVTGVEKLLDIKGNPYLKDPYLLQTYTLAAQAYAGQGDRAKSLMMIEKAEVQAAYYHTQYMFNESKLYLDELRRKNLELGVKVCYDLWQETGNNEYLVAALLYADKAKSNVLNERAQMAQKMSSISSEIRDLRFQWVYQLNALENQGENGKALKLRDRLDSLDRKLNLNVSDGFDIQELISFLDKIENDEMVLEYFVIDSVTYTFSLTKGQINADRLEYSIEQDIVDYYKCISTVSANINDCADVGHRIYNYLVSRWLIKNIATKTLRIIPDKVLSYLVFDALPVYVNERKWSELSYLSSEYTITYDFSLQSLASKQTKSPTCSYVGFAPDFTSNSLLAYLKNGEASISSAKSLFGGSTYLGNEANSENLRSKGSKASVLHLYTHGVSSDSSYDASYIYLQDRKMYVDEILTLPLQTKLCLLTACEVGLGKDYSGEGVTGVAWAFRGAGASNVVQSMWKLNENTSAILLKSFFGNLEDGMPSDEALSKAKQDYLNNPEISTRLKYPYYWAGMSHYGSGTVIKAKSYALWYSLAAGLVLLASFVFLYLKKETSAN